MRRYRTINSGRPRSLYALAQQPRSSRARVEQRCETCGDPFTGRRRDGVPPRYCSQGCAGVAYKERVTAGYPPREEIVQLYVNEGYTDRDLGRKFGHSYQWALGVRRHYDIPGRKGRSPRRKPKSWRTGWGIHLKREPACRACGAAGVTLHLHHAVPRSLSPAGRRDLRNGVPLCESCHFSWHGGRPLPRSIFTAEEWAFVGTLIGPGWLARRYPRETERAA